ncbi:MAG: choice-of-anchor Q domain-containing protein, partial [Pirellulales bacterium]
MDHSTIENNTATADGGGLYVVGPTIIDSSSIRGNTAVDGGGLLALGVVLVNASALANNTATTGAGGAIDDESRATIVGTSFIANHADTDGGAISTSDYLMVTDDYFEQNRAFSNGGAIDAVKGESTTYTYISGSTFDSNQAIAYGGALNDDFDTNGLTVTNSTFESNQAPYGGAFSDGAGATVESSTFYGNIAEGGGGGLYEGRSTALHNSIVAGNQGAASPDIDGAVDSLGHNLFESTAGITDNLASSDLVGVNPMLGLLQDNGGSTLTMAPQAGSPAIDAGDDSNAPATDQRGFPRPSGTHVDIGAVEYIHSPLAISDLGDDNVTVEPSNSAVTQNITLRDAVTMFNVQGGTNEIDLVAGTYKLTATATNPTALGLFGALVVQNENLTIEGAGAGQTIIDVSALGDRAFQVLSSGQLHLIGVTITGGSTSGTGGAIDNQGTLSLSDSAITNSVASASGGAIYSEPGTSLSLDGTTVSGNSAHDGGGIAIDSASSATISNSTISDNSVPTGGGGIEVAGPLAVSGSTIDGNSAGMFGGGVMNLTSSATLTISQTTFSNNTAQSGGGLWTESTTTIDDSTFADNVGQGAAGQDGSTDSLIDFYHEGYGGGGGGAGLGAAIFNQATLTVSNSTFTGNQAAGGAGGQVDVGSTQ